jgi:hypothetical protein
MALSRHVPTEFAEKIEAVRAAVTEARHRPRRAFEVTEEIVPGVRLVMTEQDGTPVVFSLWAEPRDVAEICGDAAYPATGGLLAMEKEQAAELLRETAVVVDLGTMVRSETIPGVHYALLDRVSDQQLRLAVERLVPARPHRD